jgi:hypothetical protein
MNKRQQVSRGSRRDHRADSGGAHGVLLSTAGGGRRKDRLPRYWARLAATHITCDKLHILLFDRHVLLLLRLERKKKKAKQERGLALCIMMCRPRSSLHTFFLFLISILYFLFYFSSNIQIQIWFWSQIHMHIQRTQHEMQVTFILYVNYLFRQMLQNI